MGAQNSPNTPYQNMIIVTFSHDIHMHFVKSGFWVDYLNLATTNYNNLGAPASPAGERAGCRCSPASTQTYFGLKQTAPSLPVR